MTQRFDARMIERIKDRVAIEAVIGRDVVLRKVGRQLLGLCPFHKDSHPSFSIDPIKRVYLCRACGASGDVITYLAKMQGIEFGPALEKLAGIAGLSEPTQPRDWPEGAARETWEKLLSVRWNPARDWLADVRGIPRDVELASGVRTLDAQCKLVHAFGDHVVGENDRGPYSARQWMEWMLKGGGQHACATPLRNATSNTVEGLTFQLMGPPRREMKTKLLPKGLSKTAPDGTPRGYGFAGASLKAPVFVLCEGRVDTLVMEAILHGQPDIACAGAVDAGEMKARWPRHLAKRRSGTVIVVPHMDPDKPDAAGVMRMGAGPDAAVHVLAQVKGSLLLDTTPIIDEMRALGWTGLLNDLGDLARAAMAHGVPFSSLQSKILFAINQSTQVRTAA